MLFEEAGQVKRLRVNPFFDQVDERDDGLDVHAAPTGLAEVAAPPVADEEELPPAADEVTVLGQLDATYLVVQCGKDLLLVDQHRAAERVIFDRLVAQPRRLSRQLLAIPVTLELDAEETATPFG